MLSESGFLGCEYIAAGYERLSKEDVDKKDESSSIESQRMIIESFCKFEKINIAKHYSDDGFTGSNFQRPRFEEMIKDIEAGLINCVIVKDLSRLGRELYETGTYIEEYFLAKNVRFIAINDGYDSKVGDELLGLRLGVNDLYLRDTSKKVRSAFDVKRKNGDYIGSFAKFGYKKHPENSSKLIVDPEIAPIIVQIFEWMASGVGTSTIAYRLTEANVPIPSIYKNEKRQYTQKELNNGNGIWRPQTVSSILTDRMYLGHMVQGRWKKLRYNSKKLIEVPEKDWIVVENTHEPIISQELFDTVQNEMKKYKKYSSKNEKKHLLQGLLVCKDCGHNISIGGKKTKTGYTYWTECNYYSKYSKYDICASHRVNYKYLEEDILQFLRQIGTMFLKDCDLKDLLKDTENIFQGDKIEIEKKITKIQSEIKKNQNILTNLYEDRLNNVISIKQFSMLSHRYEEAITELESKEQTLIFKLNEMNTNDNLSMYKMCKDLMERFMKFEIPSQELMYQLIEKIEIDKEKNIEVFFKVDIAKYMNLIQQNELSLNVN